MLIGGTSKNAITWYTTRLLLARMIFSHLTSLLTYHLQRFFPLKARNDAQGIVDKMEEYRIAHPDTPIVFHVFSNGGGFVYSRIMKIINTEVSAYNPPHFHNHHPLALCIYSYTQSFISEIR